MSRRAVVGAISPEGDRWDEVPGRADVPEEGPAAARGHRSACGGPRDRRAVCAVVGRVARRAARGDQPGRRARRRRLPHRGVAGLARWPRRLRARDPARSGAGYGRGPPMASHIVEQGHAWVASGYRAREYQPHLFIEDLVALRELFLNEIGQPRWTIIYGQALGGHSAPPITCWPTPPRPSSSPACRCSMLPTSRPSRGC